MGEWATLTAKYATTSPILESEEFLQRFLVFTTCLEKLRVHRQFHDVAHAPSALYGLSGGWATLTAKYNAFVFLTSSETAGGAPFLTLFEKTCPCPER